VILKLNYKLTNSKPQNAKHYILDTNYFNNLASFKNSLMKASLIKIFDLRLSKLNKELALYTDENCLWKTPKGINNSGGNLYLHLIGNLNHFIGAVLGNSGYKRKRDEEFVIKNIPISDLQKQIDATKEVVINTLKKLNSDDFDAIYPINVFGTEMTTTYFLIHLTGHLNYHLGQINYHRRLVC